MDEGQLEHPWDVVVIGGGAAGLSAALTLARVRRRVIVIDGGEPRNAPAAAAHGLLGLEGINPLQLLAKGREEVSSYGGQIVQKGVVDASGSADESFNVGLDDGSSVQARQLLIATGVRDELPAVPGLVERWGRDVVHCPYCHGWEIRDQRIGLLATGPMSAMQALLFHQWSEQVVFFSNGTKPSAEHVSMLAALGITIVPDPVSSVAVSEDRLTGVILADGEQVQLDALAVHGLARARLDGLDRLSLEVAENQAGIGLVADATGRTSVPGVWAAGNVVSAAMQVSEAAANGARVAMMMNIELVFARAEQAVANQPSDTAEVS